jgi:hypothetical protein
MRFLSLGLLWALLVLSPIAGAHDWRYQAVVITEGDRGGQIGQLRPKVFILDTQEGHMWTWVENLIGAGNSQVGTVLTYQGQLRPGNKAGEIIEERSLRD